MLLWSLYKIIIIITIIIAERERANLVVRSSGYAVRRVSAHARLLTRFFLSEIISKFLHIFTHAASRDMRRSI